MSIGQINHLSPHLVLFADPVDSDKASFAGSQDQLASPLLP